MDSQVGFGLFAIFIFGLWLLIFVAFGLSYVKNKYLSIVSFVIFVIIITFLVI